MKFKSNNQRKAVMAKLKCNRSDFMENRCSFKQYYKQFVTPETKKNLLREIKKEEIQKAFPKDKALNNIPLRRWDALPLTSNMVKKLRTRGDAPTLAGKVCIYKATARVIIKKQ